MARVDPALAAARGAVRAELADLAGAGGLMPGGLVLVACSGGADSLALAAATADEARRVGRSVRSPGYEVRAGAVVVDHGMQPGSADVAATAAARCRALGLDPVLVRRVRVAGEPGSGGPEAAARDARYAALDDAARETGAAAVLLGHTLNDQAESVLLGLARGSGARSLAGMPRRRGLLRRPFLGLRRAQTEAVCAALGLDYWTDPTNLLPADDGPAPARTRVRGAVVPVLEDALGPGVVEALARTADQLRDDTDLLDALAADLLAASSVEPVETPSSVEPVETPSSVEPVETPSSVEPVETPSSVEPVETPSSVEPVETPSSVEPVETPSSVEPVETPSSVEPVETPSSVEPVETTDRVSTSSTSDGVSTGSTSDGVSTGSTSDGVSTGSTGGIVLDVERLAEAPRALRRRALRAAALAVGCPPGATSARHVDALEALVVSWRGQGDVHLPGDARALRACGRLYLRPAGPGPDEPGLSRTGASNPQPRTPAPIPLFEE